MLAWEPFLHQAPEGSTACAFPCTDTCPSTHARVHTPRAHRQTGGPTEAPLEAGVREKLRARRPAGQQGFSNQLIDLMIKILFPEWKCCCASPFCKQALLLSLSPIHPPFQLGLPLGHRGWPGQRCVVKNEATSGSSLVPLLSLRALGQLSHSAPLPWPGLAVECRPVAAWGRRRPTWEIGIRVPTELAVVLPSLPSTVLLSPVRQWSGPSPLRGPGEGGGRLRGPGLPRDSGGRTRVAGMSNACPRDCHREGSGREGPA